MKKIAKHLLKSQRGFGMLESIIAIGLVAASGYFFLGYVQKLSLSSVRISASTNCESGLNSVLTAIRSQDNSLNVRTFIPKDLNSIPAQDSADPYCKVVAAGPTRNARPVAVCDTLPHITFGPGGTLGYNVGPPLQVPNAMAQNLRGAATYALSMYNTYNPPHIPSICSEGLNFTAAPSSRTLANLLQILPTDVGVDFPVINALREVRMIIRQVDRSGAYIDCTTTKSLANPMNGIGFEIQLIGTYVDTTASNQLGRSPNVKSCSVAGRVTYPSTVPRPPIPNVVFTNAGSEWGFTDDVIGPNECTCQRSWTPGMTCPEMYSIKANFTGVPPLSLPGCILAGESFGTKAGVRYCPQNADRFYVGGNPYHTGGAYQAMNVAPPGTNLSTAWQLVAGSTPDTFSSISIGYFSADGQVSPQFANLNFKVRMPSCNPSTYCPTQTPPDGCGGTCPPGTMPDNCPTVPCGVTGYRPCSGTACPVTACPVPPVGDPPFVQCANIDTFCGTPDGVAQPTRDSNNDVCPTGRSCASCPVVCGAPNENTFCQGLEVACSPDPHACIVGSIFVRCQPQPNGCGTCIMGSANCPCLP